MAAAAREHNKGTPCEICQVDKWKYKCPICELRYCCLKCYKVHKENPCSKLVSLIPPDTGAPGSDGDSEDDNDIIPLSKLHLLRNSSSILASLSNANLRAMLLDIDKASDPVKALKEAMSIPIFIEFADACLNHCGVDIVDRPRSVEFIVVVCVFFQCRSLVTPKNVVCD